MRAAAGPARASVSAFSTSHGVGKSEGEHNRLARGGLTTAFAVIAWALAEFSKLAGYG